jgi:hypothetical protein
MSVPARIRGIEAAGMMCLAGLAVAGAATAEPAACEGIAWDRYASAARPDAGPTESSCHDGSELFLPWIDPGTGIAAASGQEARSVTTFEVRELPALGAMNIDELTRIVPTVPLPGDRR